MPLSKRVAAASTPIKGDSGGWRLVFLRQDDTPMREGFERTWTVVWMGHGVFAADGSRWTNPLKISVTEDEVVASSQ